MKLWILPLMALLLIISVSAVPYGGISYYNYETVAGSTTYDRWDGHNAANNGLSHDSSHPTFAISGGGGAWSGSGGYISVGGPYTQTNNFTVSLWFSLYQPQTRTLYSNTFDNETGNYSGFHIEVDGTGHIRYEGATSTTTNEASPYSTTTYGGGWYHLSFVADPINGKTIYVDGVNISHSPSTADIHYTFSPRIYIGADMDSSNGYTAYNQMGFKGKLDEVKIFNRTLTTQEIDSIGDYGVICYSIWVCDGYENSTCLINDTSTSACNSVTDINSCGNPYTGDYTEFENQTGVCDYCTPNWNCTAWEECIEPIESTLCNTTTDLNDCYATTELPADQYSGDYTEFTNQTCDYPPAPSGGGGGGFPEEEETVNQTAQLLSVAPSVGETFDLRASWNSITGLFSADTTTEVVQVGKQYWYILAILLILIIATVQAMRKPKKGRKKR